MNPSRGLLRDCKIFANLRIAFVSSSSLCVYIQVTFERPASSSSSSTLELVAGYGEDSSVVGAAACPDLATLPPPIHKYDAFESFNKKL